MQPDALGTMLPLELKSMRQQCPSCALADEFRHHSEERNLDVGKLSAVKLEQALVDSFGGEREHVHRLVPEDGSKFFVAHP